MFGLIFYILTTCAVAAALAVIFVIAGVSLPENKARLKLLGLMLAGIVITISSYYISDFDVLMGGDGYYGPIYRALDIISSYITTVSWIVLALNETGAEAKADKAGKAAVIWASMVFLAALVVYVFCINDGYEIVRFPVIVMATQTALTASIGIVCIPLIVRLLTFKREGIRIWQQDGIIFIGAVNTAIGIYNGVMSLLIFNARYDYDNWIGINDLNSELLFLIALGILIIVIRLYREVSEARSRAIAELTTYKIGEKADRPDEYARRTGVANEYGLSPREMEIAALLYQKMSYDMMAEKLFISKYTVKRHVHNIYDKMGVTRRDDFIRALDKNVK